MSEISKKDRELLERNIRRVIADPTFRTPFFMPMDLMEIVRRDRKAGAKELLGFYEDGSILDRLIDSAPDSVEYEGPMVRVLTNGGTVFLVSEPTAVVDFGDNQTAARSRVLASMTPSEREIFAKIYP
ncbi:MAG: hypothetical protein AB200_01850 [Parcubacteria bacterium C7867-005]|nr:MAG: hypothetical protein AB200_01850 [Parcubacteria bacterium C7867-005]